MRKVRFSEPSKNEKTDRNDNLEVEEDIPSRSQIEAKRNRRRQMRENNGAFFDKDDDDDDDDDDDVKKRRADPSEATSIESDGIKIEPFHMREEDTDGTGYFDGDTYVFRNNTPLGEEEDAWVDDVDNSNPLKIDPATLSSSSFSVNKNKRKQSSQEDLDQYSKAQLYQKVLPFIGNTESIMQAIQRYGKIVKNNSRRSNQNYEGGTKQQRTNDGTKITVSDQHDVAKKNLDDLTGIANFLLLNKGEVDIYDTTKAKIFHMFPSTAIESKNSSMVMITTITRGNITTKWEYQGNEDNQLHGPYTTEQMLSWTKAGYFVGAQRVKIRTVREEKDETERSKPLSTQDDLLADIMDDDDDDDDGDDDVKTEESRPSKRSKSKNFTTNRGAWMWSSEVNFRNYL